LRSGAIDCFRASWPPCTPSRAHRISPCSYTRWPPRASRSPGTFKLLAPIASVAILLLYIACCAAAFKLQRQPAKTGQGPRVTAMLVPLLAIVALIWVLTHSTRSEFLAVGVVLLLGSVLFVIVRHRER
jgi:L-asparagine transporter-like permease